MNRVVFLLVVVAAGLFCQVECGLQTCGSQSLGRRGDEGFRTAALASRVFSEARFRDPLLSHPRAAHLQVVSGLPSGSGASIQHRRDVKRSHPSVRLGDFHPPAYRNPPTVVPKVIVRGFDKLPT
jgi:hypothetical protein